ncbi:NAD-dependent epimerase/dehydratase family protein [Bartonella sp. HY406]|uniref:NAD-dependent epimerase/dehydratase family protein n=1 Tax=Bartonella sp. HY406 TaxID=2979331 RepID=UPI0021C7AB49|nr:NAD-dependent epimerase/dehydratase family protein [Bartonella sp. HY406]UXN03590.1 NAD-dependent epimerase/dehydratase family protein [Bartonella sp. HY406]
MKAIVTGTAGFIGFHVAKQLLINGWSVVGIDNLNTYYDPTLKEHRLKSLQNDKNFRFSKADIALPEELRSAISDDMDADIIIHLAAQAGVRYSIENPYSYVHSNVTGQVTVFEQALKMPKSVPIIYASSSSVYGSNKKIPFSESDRVDGPVSVYASTKRAGELLANSYQHIHGLRSIGLRFFTVYGPWGRPDMAPWLFTDAILHQKPIKLFNYGDMMRDFTYIDDIVDGIIGAINRILNTENTIEPVYNLGNNRPSKLEEFVNLIEKWTNKAAIKQYEPMPAADVPMTYADITLAQRDLNFAPQTSLDDGLSKFISWFKAYHKI